MSSTQFIKVVSHVPGQRGALREILPGFKKVWEVLSNGFSGLIAQTSMLIEVRWPKGAKIPEEKLYQGLMGFKGQVDISLVSHANHLEFLILNQGRPNSLELLLKEALERETGVSPIYIKEHALFDFEFSGSNSGSENLIQEALEKLSQVEHTKLGLGGVGFKELKFLKEGEGYGGWEELLHLGPKDKEALSEAIFWSIRTGETSPLDKAFHLIEKKPRSQNLEQELGSLWSLYKDLFADTSPFLGVLSPGTFVTGAHLRSIEKVLDQISYGDMAAGALISLPAFSSPIFAELFSDFPIGKRVFPKSPEGGADLYILGPWTIQNTLIQKRIYLMHKFERIFQSGGYNAIVLEGLEDWLNTFLKGLSQEPGWESSEQEFNKFLDESDMRDRFDRVGFFWTQKNPEEIAAMSKKYGVPIFKVGNTAFSGSFKIWALNGEDIFSLSLEQLAKEVSEAEIKEKLLWEYPEPKSPTYGLERASIYPEQYLLKVLIWSLSDLNNVRMGTSLHSGVQLRTSRARKKYCQPMNTLIWSDGKNDYVDAVATHSGWSGIDPKGAGLASVDACVREALVMGAKPGSGTCSIWVPYPDKPDVDTLSAWHLTMMGVLEGVQEYGYTISSLSISGAVHGSNAQEVYVKIRAPLKDSKIKVVPGFRMEGEAIFAVGPKPAVVDAGSRILRYVRVQSNNTFKLQPSLQLKLYEIVYDCFMKGMVSSIRSVDNGGIAKILAEMGLWGDLGIHHRPTVPTMELYSGTPGRVIVGVLPQEIKRFEAAVGTEYATLIGIVGGHKILGLPLETIQNARKEVLEE